MQAARRAPLAAIAWAVAAGVLVADQATKFWALATLDAGEEINLVANWLTLRLTFNSGAALSILEGHTWIVTIVMILVTGALVWYLRRAAGTLAAVLFGAAIGGALGNIGDRLFRGDGWGSGEVVDMIKYGNLFIGNVADIAIVGAVAVAILMGFRGAQLLTPRAGDGSEDAAAGAGAAKAD